MRPKLRRLPRFWKWVEPGEIAPAWLGLVHRSYVRGQFFVAVIPLHLPLRLAVAIHTHVRRGFCRTWLEKHDDELLKRWRS